MCKCTPEIRTPWCGKPGCEYPTSTIGIEILEKRVYLKALAESTSTPGAVYKVQYDEDDGGWTCTCPDHKQRQSNCKHILAVKERVNL